MIRRTSRTSSSLSSNKKFHKIQNDRKGQYTLVHFLEEIQKSKKLGHWNRKTTFLVKGGAVEPLKLPPPGQLQRFREPKEGIFLWVVIVELYS